jgi:alkylation response protein AidB-like acyl-CoA dehydrogenase
MRKMPILEREEQEAIVDTVRKFCEEHVTPVNEDLDSQIDPADCFSWEIVEAAHEAGIRTLTLPEEYGGIEADHLTTAMVVEELGRADMGVSVFLAQTLKIGRTMYEATNDDQRERFLTEYAENPRGLLAIAITEPETASNYIIPYNDPSAPYRTSAAKVDGGWKINGMKHFISNGPRSSHYLLFAQTEKGVSLVDGATCFLIRAGTDGFTLGQTHNKMGERLTNNAELIFQDCFVPDEDVLGEVGNGAALMAQFFPASNAYAGASVLGVAQTAYERSVEWCKVRIQGGKPLIEHDGIRHDLSEMRMLIDVTRAYIHKACWSADRKDELGWDPTLGAYPKVIAHQTTWKVVSKALELFGGTGYMRESGIEKLVRDAAAFSHSDGVDRSLLLKGANYIL